MFAIARSGLYGGSFRKNPQNVGTTIFFVDTTPTNSEREEFLENNKNSDFSALFSKLGHFNSIIYHIIEDFVFLTPPSASFWPIFDQKRP